MDEKKIAAAIEAYVDERLALLQFGADRTPEECAKSIAAARERLEASLK